MKVNITPTDKPFLGFNIHGRLQTPEVSTDVHKTAQKPAANLYLDASINDMLKQLTDGICQRENLLNRLPSNIKEAVMQVLQQKLPSQEDISKGLSTLFTSQKNAIIGLQDLDACLSEAILIKNNSRQKLPDSLIKTLDQLIVELGDNDHKLAETISGNSPPKLLTDFLDSTSYSLTSKESQGKNQQLSNGLHRILSQLISGSQLQGDYFNNLLELVKLRNTLQSASLNSACPQAEQADVQQTDQGMLSQETSSNTLTKLTIDQNKATDELPDLEDLVTDAININNNGEQKLTDSDIRVKLISEFLKSLNIPDSNVTNNPFVSKESPDQHLTLLNDLQQILAKLMTDDQPKDQLLTNKLPELIKLRNAFQLSSLDSDILLKAKETILEIAATIHKSVALNEETSLQANAKIFSFTLPLYFENNPQPYPAYIHVYHEQKDKNEIDKDNKNETWLRICLATENIGVVDLTFKLYQDNLVNLLVSFTSDNASSIFKEYIPQIRSEFKESPLTLNDINIK